MIKLSSINLILVSNKLFLVFLAGITDFVKTDSEVIFNNVIDVYKCQGSKVTSGFQIPVPSYSFDTEILLRIKENLEFPGCANGNLEEATLLYTPDEPFPALNPQGVLDVDRHYYDPEEYCVFEYTPASIESEVSSLKLNYCPSNCSRSGINGDELCIRKCCGAGQVLDFRDSSRFGCEPSGNKTWYPTFYDPNFSRSSISKIKIQDLKLKPHFFKQSIKQVCDGNYAIWSTKKIHEEITRASTRLLSNGKFVFIDAQRSWTLLDKEFCIDGVQNFNGPNDSSLYSGEELDQVLFICGIDVDLTKPQDDNSSVSMVYMYSMFIASFFYFATALVILLLWEEQNTHGWTVFSLVTSQFFMCIFIGNAHRVGIYKTVAVSGSAFCIANAVLGHFFTLASFAWLTVTNFDLWSTFRSLRHRPRKAVDLKKFGLYSLISWGLPLSVVIVGLILDNMFPDRESFLVVPEYGIINCYMARWAQGPYVYYIMACLLATTLVFAVLSCLKIFQLHRDTAPARTSSSAGDRKLFLVYAKLSVVLGTSWIFEFISWAVSTETHLHWIWIVFDLYNFLTALFVFIIFACKRTNLIHLVEKYPYLTCFKRITDNLTKKKDLRGDATGSTNISQHSGPPISLQTQGQENGSRHEIQWNSN